MGYYRQHVFVCINQKSKGKKCCAEADAEGIHAYAKKRVKQLGLGGAGGIRVNKSGCLGRCSIGPCLVIYPDNVWYKYETEADIDEIIDRHLINGEIVTRLQLASEELNR